MSAHSAGAGRVAPGTPGSCSPPAHPLHPSPALTFLAEKPGATRARLSIRRKGVACTISAAGRQPAYLGMRSSTGSADVPAPSPFYCCQGGWWELQPGACAIWVFLNLQFPAAIHRSAYQKPSSLLILPWHLSGQPWLRQVSGCQDRLLNKGKPLSGDVVPSALGLPPHRCAQGHTGVPRSVNPNAPAAHSLTPLPLTKHPHANPPSTRLIPGL